MTEHPINLSTHQVDVWVDKLEKLSDIEVFTEIARFGADVELEACCDFIPKDGACGTKFQREQLVKRLKAKRRPKPPSLKRQALSALYAIALGADDTREFYQDIETIKIALSKLPDEIE